MFLIFRLRLPLASFRFLVYQLGAWENHNVVEQLSGTQVRGVGSVLCVGAGGEVGQSGAAGGGFISRTACFGRSSLSAVA
jgi:hypothetical protein